MARTAGEHAQLSAPAREGETSIRSSGSMARRVLIVWGMKTVKDPNQGEGDKASARHYNRDVREFIAEGKVDEAAREAAHYVESEPRDAERAERKARKGPSASKVSVDELVAKGRTVIDRVRPIVDRVVDRVRTRFSRK